MNWHAYRRSLIQPFPLLATDALTNQPALVRTKATVLQKSRTFPYLLPYSIVQRILRLDGLHEARSTFEDLRHHYIFIPVIRNWMKDTCSGAFDLRFGRYHPSHNGFSEWFAYLDFVKESDRDAFHAALDQVRRTLLVNVIARLTRLDLKTMFLIADDRNFEIDTKAHRSLRQAGHIEFIDGVRKTVLTDLGESVLAIFRSYGFDAHAHVSIIFRDDTRERFTEFMRQVDITQFEMNNEGRFQMFKSFAHHELLHKSWHSRV